MGGLFKYLICGLFAFLAYNEFVMMKRASSFNELSTHMERATVANIIGEPEYTYHCGSGEQIPAFFTYIDSMCKEKVTEVDAYALCRVPMRCRGWHYVAYDTNNKLVTKYRLTN
jgi:hypothetical protein